MCPNGITFDDLDNEMEKIDEAIIVHKRIIEDLREQRYELYARKHDWQMQEVFEYAVENDMKADDMMKLLLTAIGDKKCKS